MVLRRAWPWAWALWTQATMSGRTPDRVTGMGLAAGMRMEVNWEPWIRPQVGQGGERLKAEG